MRQKTIGIAAWGLFLVALWSTPAVAQPRSWRGMAGNTVENPLNWDPVGLVNTNDTLLIGNLVTDADARMDSTLAVTNLSMFNSAKLNNAGGYYIFPYDFQQSHLTVSGATTLNNSSELRIRLNTGSLMLANSSLYESDLLEVAGVATVLADAELGIYGDALFHRSDGAALVNNGLITAGGVTRIEVTSNGLLDLDGAGERGTIQVVGSPLSADTEGDLTIVGELADDFDGTLILGDSTPQQGARVSFDHPWTAGPNSVINFLPGSLPVGNNGGFLGRSRIDGAPFTAQGAINVSGANSILADVALTEGALVNLEVSGNLDFFGSTTLGDVSFSGLGKAIFHAPLTVAGGHAYFDSRIEFDETPNLLVTSSGIMEQEAPFEMGPGQLVIEEGGQLRLRNTTTLSTGLATIDGLLLLAGDTTMTGGYLGEGRITFSGENSTLQNRGSVQVGSVYVTSGAGLNSGSLTVDDSTINTERLVVVDSAQPAASATLHVVNGSTVNVFDLTTDVGTLELGGVSANTDAQLIVDGDGSAEQTSVDVEGGIYLGVGDLGDSAHGRLEVVNGGRVEAGADVQIGGPRYFLNEDWIREGKGFVLVGGESAASGAEAELLVGGNVNVGQNTPGGEASLSLLEGGRLEAQTLTVNAPGSYTQSGGTLDVQNLQVNNTQSFNHTGGSIFLSAGNGSFAADYAYGGPAEDLPKFYVYSGADLTTPSGWTIGDGPGTFGHTAVGGALPDGGGRSTLRGLGSGSLIVGDLGVGTLDIDGGGLVAFLDDTIIAHGDGSEGTINVRDVYDFAGNTYRSTLEVLGGPSAVLTVGREGRGVLNIERGGRVETSANMYLGMFADGHGEVTVGTDSFGYAAELNVGDTIFVGNQGTGLMTINDGGVVTAQQMFVKAGSEMHLLGGTLSLDLLDVNTYGGVVQMDGNYVYDVDTTIGSVDFVNGRVEPGDSPGIMTVQGDYTSLNTTLAVELGGLLPGSEYDRVEVTGSALLDGALEVSLYDLGGGQFVPEAGDSFDIFTALAGVTGSFETLSLPSLGSDLEWSVGYGSNAVTLSVLSNKQGDFDGDGRIDGRDLNGWEAGFGLNGTADSDGDGDSDGADFLAWQRAAGAADGNVAPTFAAVPEPSALMLAAVASSVLLARRRVQERTCSRSRQTLEK